jgi:ATP-dependent helicase Lhr and Lhr-like helicase
MPNSNPINQLHPVIQKWLSKKNWEELRPIQVHAINALLTKDYKKADCIISAPTAGGKTMAALLPLCTLCLNGDASYVSGFRILYISPLKALIREQADRAKDIADLAETIRSHTGLSFGCAPWNSDVDSSRKEKIWADPTGILLITPESIEGRLLHDPRGLNVVLSKLEFIVVDELHAYFDTPRGHHLISLLARLERRLNRRVPRICLSATLGNASSSVAQNRDLERIARFLRPSEKNRPIVITEKGLLKSDSVEPAQEIAFELNFNIVKSSQETHRQKNQQRNEIEDAYRDTLLPGQREIVLSISNLFSNFGAIKRGVAQPPLTALVFANSRHAVETFTAALNAVSPAAGLSDAWRVRQASVAKIQNRLQASEKRYKDLRRFWAHHGSLDRAERHHAETRMATGEIGCVLVCTTTLELGIDVGAIENVVQIGPGPSVSSLRQRLGRSRRLAQQDAQYGAGSVTRPRLDMFVAERDSAVQNLGLLDSLRLQSFQALAQLACLKERKYESPRDSSLDLSTLVQQVLCVRRREIQVRPSRSGHAPRFPGDPIPVSGLVIRKMRALYDLTAKSLTPLVMQTTSPGDGVVETLKEGLKVFKAVGLHKNDVIERDGDVYIFPWAGQRHINGYLAVLRACLIQATALGPVIIAPGADKKGLAEALEDRWPKLANLESHELVRGFANGPNGKFDACLAPIFWRHDFVSDQLSENAVRRAAQHLSSALRLTTPRKKR